MAPGAQTRRLDGERLERLIEVGRSLVAELNLPNVLDRVLEVAREITGARYAALGILDEEKRELEQFLTVGIDESERSRIGSLPRGHGVLGLLIRDPRPLRLDDVGAHPDSYGFPPDHPPMKTFLGVPVLIRGEAWGNLYLTDKQGGSSFTEEDEEALLVLADWAAIAIENARLYEGCRAQAAVSSSARCAVSRPRPRSPARSPARPSSSAYSSWSSSAAARSSRRRQS